MSVVIASLALSGCYSEGGPGYSADMGVYVSHEHQPWTISVVDTRTRQPVWSIDVPVGQQLVLQFVKGEGTAGSFTPDTMKWALMDAGADSGPMSNQIAVPDKFSRRIDTYLRNRPELAGDMPSTFRRAPVSEVADPVTTPQQPEAPVKPKEPVNEPVIEPLAPVSPH